MDGRRTFGLIVIAVGLLLLGAQLFDFSIGHLFANYWPFIIIIIGVLNIVTHSGSKIGGILFVAVGILLQLGISGYINVFDYISLWPILLVIFGLWLLFSRDHKVVTDSKDTFNVLGAFSGANVKSNSTNFRGGSASAVFGGVEIDLRDAVIPQGQEAKIDLFVAFGGIELFVPSGWNVNVKGIPLFGGWDDNTLPHHNDTDGPVLNIHCFVMFGGVDIKY